MKIFHLLTYFTFVFSNFLTAQSDNIHWNLVYSETFDSLIVEPKKWTEDTYGDTSKWHVDIFDEDGDFFTEVYGSSFKDDLNKFRSFRKSFTYGKDGWLTFELYGRDEDKDSNPESGGKFMNENGKAKIICQRHTDAAIIRTSDELPEIYRLQVTVSNINFGGDQDDDGNWFENGKFNGYDSLEENAGPWRQDGNGNGVPAYNENGIYFLGICDFHNPAPHNNVFWHHHRKLVMDTDNNNYDGSSWSQIYNPSKGTFEEDGNRYISMLWLQGEDFGSDFVGNEFVSWTTQGWMYDPTFIDKYLPDESYVFTVERTTGSYTISVSGNFYYGGKTTYTATKKITEYPVVWHYNRRENYDGSYNQIKEYNGKEYQTWPADSYYPDYFFCGDPHINFYEGTAEYDNLMLWEGNITTGMVEYKSGFNNKLSAYPNPFNPATTIDYQIMDDSNVKLVVYNIIGQEIKILTNKRHSAGKYKTNWDASGYPSGIYLIELQTDSKRITKQLAFVK